MSIESEALGYSSVRYSTKKALKFVPGLLKRLGAKQLSDQEIEELKATTFPRSILIVKICIYALYLLFVIYLSLFVSPKLFYFLQKFLFSGNAVYFTSGTSFIVSIVSMFSFFLLLWPLIGYPLWFISPKIFKKSLEKDWADFGHYFDFLSVTNATFFLGLVIYFIFSPLVLLSLHSYKAVYQDGVVANDFLNITNNKYKFSDIKSVSVTSTVHQPSSTESDPSIDNSLIFSFYDGRSTNFWEDPMLGKINTDQIKNMYQVLRENNVVIQISNPSQEELSIVKSQCPSFQREFYAFYELNYRVQPVSGCIY